MTCLTCLCFLGESDRLNSGPDRMRKLFIWVAGTDVWGRNRLVRRRRSRRLTDRVVESVVVLGTVWFCLALLAVVLAVFGNLTPGLSFLLLEGVPALIALIMIVYVVDPKLLR